MTSALRDPLFNTELVANIRTLVQSENCPNLLLYGYPGSGKHYILKLIQHDDKQKKFHIIDIKEVIDQVDKLQVIDRLKNSITRIVGGTRDLFAYLSPDDLTYEVIVLDNMQLLDNRSQMMLRRLMEVYSRNFRYFLISTNVNNLIDPIRSRCACFRVKSPSNQTLRNILQSCKSFSHIPKFAYDNIIETSHNNITDFLIMCGFYTLGYDYQENKRDEDSAVSKLIQELLRDDFFYQDVSNNVVRALVLISPVNLLTRILNQLGKRRRLTDKIIFKIAAYDNICRTSEDSVCIPLMSLMFELWQLLHTSSPN